jgi:hypothetical protein
VIKFVFVASILSSITSEYKRYKALGDSALAQLDEREFAIPGPNDGNSAAVLVWHVGGNLRSRFQDFLTTDGEKAWRKRDEEFERRSVTRSELFAKWNSGWDELFRALDELTDDQLQNTITIRGQSFEVHDALHRSLAHVSYHVGQLVYLAKSIRGDSWNCLSIPIGQSEAYNKNPVNQDAAAHAAAVAAKTTKRD